MPRKTDEQDSTASVWFNYFVAILVTGGIFAVDIFTSKGILDGTLIGMLITKVWDGISKQNDYFFPSRRSDPKQEEGDKNTDERANP